MHTNGVAGIQNSVTAIKYVICAAEQGHANAQFYLGDVYDKGKGVPINDKEAAKWYTLAAEQGHMEAQFCLGDI